MDHVCRQEKWRSYAYAHAYLRRSVYAMLLNPTPVVLFSIGRRENLPALTWPARRINRSGAFTFAKISKFTSFATVTDVYLPMQKCLRYRVLRCRGSLMDRTPRFASFADNTDVEPLFLRWYDKTRMHYAWYDDAYFNMVVLFNSVSKVPLRNTVDLTVPSQD